MFTGIITHTQQFNIRENYLIIGNDDFWNDINLGDSISINGICLTVRCKKDNVKFQISEETFEKTNLHTLSIANVEKAAKIGDRNNGHNVLGHVHETCILHKIIYKEDSYDLWFKISKNSIHKLLYKDSIAINGVSLTIADIDNENYSFKVAMIQHTWENTNFKSLSEATICNVEFNIQSIIFNHEDFMKIALEESLKGTNTSPNPKVGCVIVKDNKIVSKGYHKAYGNLHAEVEALNTLPKNITNCTLYCTLEPCCHYGKQPPCTKAIIESKQISKVIIGLKDPDSKVSGNGFNELKNAGIEVIYGILKNEIEYNLRSYLYHRNTKKSYMIGKLAISSDNVYAIPNQNILISSETAKLHSHKFRKESQCTLIGASTLLIDNPELTIRNVVVSEESYLPSIAVLDLKSKIKQDHYNCFQNRNVYIFGNDERHYTKESIKYFKITSISEIPDILGSEGILQCLVEGGGDTINMLTNYLKELHIYKSNKYLGYGKQFHIPLNFKITNTEIIDDTTYLCSLNNEKNLISDHGDFDDINDAISDYKNGKPIIVMDNEDRENEGDIIVAGKYLTKEIVSLYQNFTTGIMCAVISKNKAQRLKLEPMNRNNTDNHQTAFTVSCDACNTTTGVSAEDRLETILALHNEQITLRKPGHIFPLVAKPQGLSVRKGHTEAGYDLNRICFPDTFDTEVAFISELINYDGSMMRHQNACKFAKSFNFKIIHVNQIYEFCKKSNIYNANHELGVSPLNCLASCELETKYGKWKLMSYESKIKNTENKVLYKCENPQAKPYVRIHSECFTGDVLYSNHCDCGDQLKYAMKEIHNIGHGIIIFPAGHEGRGIGFTNKIKAYQKIKNDNLDTYKANIELGFKEDERDFSECALILKDLKIDNFTFFSSNPNKIIALNDFKLDVEYITCGMCDTNLTYLSDKAKKHGTFKLSTEFQASKDGRYAIVKANWHSDYIVPFVEKIKSSLEIKNADVYDVPGCFEIPLKIKQIAKKYDCVIAIGAIVKGDTYHFECISDSVTQGLMTIQLETMTPIVDGILSCYNVQQMIERLSDPSAIVDTAKFLASSYSQ